jgi:acyl-CoA synthetase (NDP forming)
VLKALGPAHKSDAGGVVAGIAGPEALAAALADLSRVLAPASWSIEACEDTAAGFELLVGARRDRRFGPVVLVAAGGVLAEILRDTAVTLAPVDTAAAARLLETLACTPVLAGARGRPPLDVAAAAETVAALSRFAAAHPEVAEVEVNPLLVRREGALALDARIVLADQPR